MISAVAMLVIITNNYNCTQLFFSILIKKTLYTEQALNKNKMIMHLYIIM